MGILIDSSVLIAAERGSLDLRAILSGLAEESFALSAVSASEILHGLHRAKTPAQRTRREAFVEGHLTLFPVLPADLRVARLHARLWADLAKEGAMVGLHDLWIGATALSHGYKIATRDMRSFPKVPGLDVVKW